MSKNAYHLSKETYIYVKSDQSYVNKETLIMDDGPKQLFGFVLLKRYVLFAKRDLYRCQKRPRQMSRKSRGACQKRPIWMSKETNMESKEIYMDVKRDLYGCQKRPIWMSEETYIDVERDFRRRWPPQTAISYLVNRMSKETSHMSKYTCHMSKETC